MNLAIKDKEWNDWSCLIILNTAFKKHRIALPINYTCGIFTAVLSGKEHVPTQDWVKLFMDESTINEIDSTHELLQALFTVHNKIAMQLYDDKFKPVFLESMKTTVNWHEGSTESIIQWCSGYCQGMELSSSVWLKEQYEYSMPIAFFGGVIETDDKGSLTDEELTELAMNIPSLAQSIYNMGFDARERLRTKKYKLGRNEPCYCGSGKKYKKCCLRDEIEETIH